LHIHPDVDIDGYIKVKIFEPTVGEGLWVETFTDSSLITVAEQSTPVYVAKTPADCGSFTPCFVNSGDDLENGIGTGLRDAVMALDAGSEIRILKDYTIKDHAVLVDKALDILGHENGLITYIGTVCSNPMLSITDGATIAKLTINDGNCISPSRNLIEVNSANPVAIEHNTLVYGNHAVYAEDNTGDVIVAFNYIANNDDYGVFRAIGNSLGTVNIYANNIINNRLGYQVNCNDHGIANHNFWGEGVSATASALSCTITNGKRLGAPILLSTTQPGVQAERKTVSSQISYAFDGNIGVQHSASTDFDVIIVNHGQGSAANIPFYDSGSGDLNACSNFYDVFLADDAVATNLVLALRYDLNSNCVSKIETSEYCGSSDSTKYPLWWYDPATNATDGWDRTGQNPQGPGAGGAAGQETICNISAKEIRVIIDNTGRPSISTDLNFTPFVVGLPIVDGIVLSQLTAQFDGSKVNVKWITSSETNVQGFYVLRSDTQTGTYSRISQQINAIGDTYIGGIYQYSDATVTFGKTYYYKIEVIDNNGQSIGTYGPVSILTVTPTPTATATRTITLSPTATQTRTSTTIPTATRTRTPTKISTATRTRTPINIPTLFRTRTPYPYNTPTSYYQPRTATPSDGPTPVRTYGPSPTGTLTTTIYPTDDQTPEATYTQPGYPVETEGTPPTDGYPIPGTPRPTQLTPTPTGTEPELDEPDQVTPTPGMEDEDDLPTENIRWIFILVGAASGLSLIGAVSVILAKSRYG
jgi:hypothetical protein